MKTLISNRVRRESSVRIFEMWMPVQCTVQVYTVQLYSGRNVQSVTDRGSVVTVQTSAGHTPLTSDNSDQDTDGGHTIQVTEVIFRQKREKVHHQPLKSDNISLIS